MSVPIAPLSPDELAIVSRIVDEAPPLSPSCVAELAAIFGGAS